MTQTHSGQRHASLQVLLALRDRQPLDAYTLQHVENCHACSETLNKLHATRKALRALSDPEPDMKLWDRIRNERQKESLPRVSTWASMNITRAIAASVSMLAVAALLGTIVLRTPSEEFSLSPISETTPGNSPLNDSFVVSTTSSLQQRSQYLENVLVKLGPRPSVQNLRDTSAVESLQSSIALIDYQLGLPAEELSDSERRELWQRRVELMESLLTVRVAADRRNSI